MPIKRNEYLKPLSRDHHHGLLLCWKIREGFKKGIELERIKSYIDWFYTNHLVSHFKTEEKFVFPILGNDHDLIKKALSEHRRLTRLFEQTSDLAKTLSILEEELENHIRFEERVLFNEIQAVASESEIQVIQNVELANRPTVEWQDEFWK